MQIRGKNHSPAFSHVQVAAAKLAEDPESDASIAIFDTFGETGSHGEFVESLITEVGFKNEDVQRYDNTFEVPLELLKTQGAGFGERLDTFIQETPQRLIQQTSANLEDVLKRGQAKVVNISLGDSKIDTVERLVNYSKHNSSFEESLWKEFGLSSQSGEKSRIQALALRIDEVVDNSESLREAKSEFENLVETAKAQDVHVVLAAGNQGALATAYENAQIPVKDDFFASHLAVDSALIVGATTSSGERANFSPPRAGVDLAAQGAFVVGRPHGRPEVRDGTSFAAPKVTRVLAQINQDHPEENFEARESRLMMNVESVPGAETYLGAGILKQNSPESP